MAGREGDRRQGVRLLSDRAQGRIEGLLAVDQYLDASSQGMT